MGLLIHVFVSERGSKMKDIFLEDDFHFATDYQHTYQEQALPQKPLWKDVFQRFSQNKGAIIGCICILVVIILAIIVPMLSSWNYDDINTQLSNQTPNATHWFGTDEYGRDIFVRVWKGARISLFIAVIAMVIDVGIGVVYGMVSGYFGGKVDMVLQRILEVMNSIPTLVVLIILLTIMKSSLYTIIIALAFTEWIGMARITRAQVLKVKEEEFVLASRTLGAKHIFIICKQILPNIFGQLIIMFMMNVPNAIFYEAYLAFIGLGLPKPEASLGTLINDGFDMFLVYPHMMLIPAAILAILMLSFNLFGDGMKDALDPKMKEM